MQDRKGLMDADIVLSPLRDAVLDVLSMLGQATRVLCPLGKRSG